MHILILPSWYKSFNSPLNGIFIREQAYALERSGCKVGVIYNHVIYLSQFFKNKRLSLKKVEFIDDQNIKTFTDSTIQVPSFRLFTFLNKIVFKVNRLRNKKKWMKLFQIYTDVHGIPDVIHAHSFSPGDGISEIVRKYNIKCVLTEHWSGFSQNKIPDNYYKLVCKAYSVPSVVIFVSETLKKKVQRHINLNLKTTVIPNLVNLDMFELSCLKRKKFTYISVGFLNEWKRFDLLLSAFSNMDDAELLIVGDGPQRKNLEELAVRLNSEVQFLGQMDRNSLAELLGQSHVLVTVSKFETFGMTVLEALACGIPVVTTRTGGTEEIVNTPTLGIVCGDSECEITAALEKIRSNYSEYNSDMIREHVRRHYSSEVIAKEIVDIYNSVLTN